MKRWGYWLLAVLAVSLLGKTGGTGIDVAKLQPVEVVSITCVEGNVQIRTDTADMGVGRDLHSAIENLKNTTPAEVFLDTAEYLLVDEINEKMLDELTKYLRPSCRVCILEGEAELDCVASFLAVHQPIATVRMVNAGLTNPQTLRVGEGRMELVL